VRPRLLNRLAQAGRVTMISAPAGSGKTYLLRSWVREAGLERSTAWVQVNREESEPNRFWSSVLSALRNTVPGSISTHKDTGPRDLDDWTVEQLLVDLTALGEPLWLVIDDLDELRSPETLGHLELFLSRAPAELRVALATRHDLRLGLHRARLDGELTELRADDLRFTVEEARDLFEMAGVTVPDSTLTLLVKRTEGWGAGLRMAALSLAGHEDPDQFAAQFSGTYRGIADYLMAEVLERQPEEVRSLLLRTSILEEISAPLADRLMERIGSQRILQDLEDTNAFVTSVDASRSSFRFHPLFAELLRLELRRTAPEEVGALHRTAATWLASRGRAVEAVQHAQAAEDWDLATRSLFDQWYDLLFSGRIASAYELLAGFPDDRVDSDPELALLFAARALSEGSVDDAERLLALAEQRHEPIDRKHHAQLNVMLALQGMSLARRRGDVQSGLEGAGQLATLIDCAAPTEGCALVGWSLG
jgi:LuxR family transcriptional regulator, maltose regulon positive regulatory protein